MPRQARLDGPGALHHVMIRGIERRAIFRSNQDREDFLDWLGSLFSETNEQFEQRYRLERMGYDLKTLADRVAELYRMDSG